MLEGLQFAARFAQYAVLLTLFGLSAFGLYASAAAQLLPMRRLLGGGAIAGLIACAFGLFAQTGAMSGALGDAVKPDMLWTIVSATHYGAAWAVRVAVLVMAMLATSVTATRPRLTHVLVLHMSAIAVASLAWGGHAAGGEGLAGLVHLVADILHLLAAGLWVGALVAFCLLVGGSAVERLKPIAQSLAGFAGVGSFIAAMLVLTGLINTAYLVPLHALPTLPGSAWAQILALKLVLFAGMLCLAATNRFVLTPRLSKALLDPSREAQAVKGLRLSLLTETALVFAVLALVAWLGMLHPPSHEG